MTAARIAPIGLGALLLVLALVLGAGQARSRSRLALAHNLESVAVERTASLADAFERSRSIDLISAQNPSFTDLYTPDRDGATLSRATAALAYLEQLYPGRIGEACFIDVSGRELARVVRGEWAQADELSPDESANPFFAPTLRQAPGIVYQAAPYVSPDTGEWVISNSTQVADAQGRALGIVHFELTVDSLRHAVAGTTHHFAVQIVNRATGQVVTDSRYPQRVGAKLGAGRSVDVSALRYGSRPALIDGRLVAARRLPEAAGNANDWVVLASAPVTALSWWNDLGPGPLAMILLAATMLVLGLVGFRSYNRRLEHAAYNDSLTGLPNRILLQDRAAVALATARRHSNEVGLLLIDLDRFKEVNDTLGHHQGDTLLVAVGQRIRDRVRAGDTVARLGGDEFAVLLAEVRDADAAMVVARDILIALQQPFQVGDLSFVVEGSIGVATAQGDGTSFATLLKHADIAMYVAKESHAGAAVYEPSHDHHNPRRLSMVGELREGIERGELVLHFQPKVDLSTGRTAGVEALVRWMHPQRGLIMPDEFIHVAEHTALIRPLTEYVLSAALRQCRVWLDDGVELAVSVNMSTRCLLDVGFADVVQQLLTAHDVPGRLLTLEVTETAIMADPHGARQQLERLHQLGVQLSIDDFGTGYSSLAYLRTLPVDELKIDRSFVTDMRLNESDAVIVRSVIGLGNNLGLRVVAEGVEDEVTREVLVRAGCAEAQGFLWSRPVVPSELPVIGLAAPTPTP